MPEIFIVPEARVNLGAIVRVTPEPVEVPVDEDSVIIGEQATVEAVAEADALADIVITPEKLIFAVPEVPNEAPAQVITVLVTPVTTAPMVRAVLELYINVIPTVTPVVAVHVI